MGGEEGLGLVRTVGPCAQRIVAVMPFAIATVSDALSNNWHEITERFERPAKQARSVLFHTISSLIAMFKQSENIAIAHFVGARAAACYESCGRYKVQSSCHFHLCMRKVPMGNLAQLCMNYVYVL